MKEKLLSCPFCGEKIEIETLKWESGLKWYVQCGWCGSSTGSHSTKKLATKAWNRRAK